MISARFCIRGVDCALELPGRGVTVLSGSSGAGKTSILRAIAGLERHAGGYLDVNGQRWQDGALFVPPHRRALGYVFQEASLFAHLTVAGNLDFARKRARRAAIDLGHAVELLGIGHLLDRRTPQLSGGERQRVAIARALLTSPSLLLLDEPLASLDRQRKDDVLPYLERIHAQLDVPMLYVSHAADEVARLADHIVVIDGGAVRASGPAAEMLARLDLAMEVNEDAGVVVHGKVDAVDGAYGLLRLDVGGQALFVAHPALPLGTVLRLRILARDVSLALSRQDDSSILNHFQATVAALRPGRDPAQVLVSLDAGGIALQAQITRRSRDALGIAPGGSVWVQVKTAALLPLQAG